MKPGALSSMSGAPLTLAPLMQGRWPWPGTVAVLGGIGLVEIGLAVGAVVGVLTWSTAVAVHAVVVAVLVVTARRQIAAGQKDPLWLLFIVSTAGLGAVGVLGTALAALLRRQLSAQATGVDDWHAALFPEVESKSSAALYDRILRGESSAHERSTLAPFSDVMASGTVENKQAVITLIASHFKPVFAAALRGALNDDEPAVRVQAATAVARIENGFLRWSIFFEDRRLREPDRPEFALQLAHHYDDYANTGLLDSARARTARLRALDLYREYEQRGPSDGQVRNSIIRLLVRLGRQDEAVAAFAPLIDSGQAAPELLAWYVECLYGLGRYAELRAVCAQFQGATRAVNGISDACQRAMSLWAGQDVPEAGTPP